MKQRLLVAFLPAQMLFVQFPMDTVGAAELNAVAGTCIRFYLERYKDC